MRIDGVEVPRALEQMIKCIAFKSNDIVRLYRIYVKRCRGFLLDGELALAWKVKSKVSYVNCTASLPRWQFLLSVLASIQE